MPGAFWLELSDLLEEGFTGQIVLHCQDGQVKAYDELRRRPVQTEPAKPGGDLPPLDRRSGKL